jgi:hypothetical protein
MRRKSEEESESSRRYWKFKMALEGAKAAVWAALECLKDRDPRDLL